MRSPHLDDASLCELSTNKQHTHTLKLDAKHVTCLGVAFDMFACYLHGGRDTRSNYVIILFVVLLYY